jgi:hypothetical protein
METTAIQVGYSRIGGFVMFYFGQTKKSAVGENGAAGKSLRQEWGRWYTAGKTLWQTGG